MLNILRNEHSTIGDLLLLTLHPLPYHLLHYNVQVGNRPLSHNHFCVCRLCKLPSFSVDSKISKIFYVFLFLICIARSCFFGVASFLYADVYDLEGFKDKPVVVPSSGNGTNDTNGYMGIDQSPKTLVIFLISPEYLVIFAYFLLFWQLLSLYYDGHANLFKSVLQGKGKYFITIIGVVLLVSQTILIVQYL